MKIDKIDDTKLIDAAKLVNQDSSICNFSHTATIKTMHMQRCKIQELYILVQMYFDDDIQFFVWLLFALNICCKLPFSWKQLVSIQLVCIKYFETKKTHCFLICIADENFDDYVIGK